MATVKLTKRAIERLAAPTASGRQELVWDAELKGFGVLVSGASATKTFVVQRKLPDGRARRVTVGAVNVLTIEAARAAAIAVLADFAKGVDPKAERRAASTRAITLRDALDAYLLARASNLREKTRADYRSSASRCLAPWLDQPIRHVTAEMVEKRHREIAAEVAKRQAGGRRGGGPANGESTANGAMRIFRLVWNFVAAERDPTLPPHPVSRLRRRWFPEARRERLVKADELPAFYAAACALPNPIQRDFLLLLLFTGLRRKEAAALRWEEVDFAERVIRLPAKRTKAGRRLDLPMSDFVRDLLVARRAVGRDGEYVFPADSRSGHFEEPKFPLAQVAAATGIRVSAHDLRRTFVTVAESTDISPLALKALVNHSLGNDVTSGYIISTAERLREPVQRVADRLKVLCGVPAAPDGVAKAR